jgi:hypothetical protein
VSVGARVSQGLLGGKRPWLTRAPKFGCTLGAYDARLPLVTDLALVAASYLGGADAETGSAHLCGTTASLDFPVQHALQPGKDKTSVAQLNPAARLPPTRWRLGRARRSGRGAEHC